MYLSRCPPKTTPYRYKRFKETTESLCVTVVGAGGRGAVPGAHRAAGGGGAPRQPGHQAPALRPHPRADQLLRVRIV